MNASSTTSPTSDLRAALMVGQAGRLRRAAVTIRRLAGHLTYHPVTNQRPQVSPELLEALATVEQVVKEIQRATDERAMEEVAMSEQIRLGHAAMDQGVQAITSVLEVLRATLAAPDGAVLDAPYGRGAPARHHPGALCTMLAERVEHLAIGLEVTAILKANLSRAAGSTFRRGA